MRWRTVSVAGIAVLSAATWGLLAQGPAPKGQSPDRREGARGGPPGRAFEPPRMPLMTALDANSDGELSAEEISAASQALKKLDKNGDGKLSPEELRPVFGGRGGPGGPGRPEGRRGMGPSGPGQPASFDAATRPKDDAERKVLKALQEISQKQGRMMNVPAQDGRLLRLLAETTGAKTVVEIGTSNGVSAIWLATALRKTGGKLITHEIDAQRAALARENFASAGVADRVTIVEGDAHQTVSKLTGPIDLVFIDADKEGYLDYLKKVLPLVRPGGLVLAHNMNPRMADAEFVKAITADSDLETLFFTEGGGMSVTMKKR